MNARQGHLGPHDPSLIPRVLQLGRRAQLLKRIPRTGWLLRGVAAGEAESVADHSYGTSLTALLLAQVVDVNVDAERLLTITLLHDLAEAALGDWPGPASRFLPSEVKHRAELEVLAHLLEGLPFADKWLALWHEYQTGNSVEGRLAQDADKLDMMLQAASYEAAGRRGLGEFWEGMASQSWHFPESAALFRLLAEER